MKIIHLVKSSSLVLAFCLGLVGIVNAQPEGQTDFTDAQLESFVAIQVELQEIRAEYSARLQNTNDPQEAQALQDEASQEMLAVVEGNNLNVDSYNAIIAALQQDEELQQRVLEMMEQG